MIKVGEKVVAGEFMADHWQDKEKLGFQPAGQKIYVEGKLGKMMVDPEDRITYLGNGKWAR